MENIDIDELITKISVRMREKYDQIKDVDKEIFFRELINSLQSNDSIRRKIESKYSFYINLFYRTLIKSGGEYGEDKSLRNRISFSSLQFILSGDICNYKIRRRIINKDHKTSSSSPWPIISEYKLNNSLFVYALTLYRGLLEGKVPSFNFNIGCTLNKNIALNNERCSSVLIGFVGGYTMNVMPFGTFNALTSASNARASVFARGYWGLWRNYISFHSHAPFPMLFCFSGISSILEYSRVHPSDIEGSHLISLTVSYMILHNECHGDDEHKPTEQALMIQRPDSLLSTLGSILDKLTTNIIRTLEIELAIDIHSKMTTTGQRTLTIKDLSDRLYASNRPLYKNVISKALQYLRRIVENALLDYDTSHVKARRGGRQISDNHSDRVKTNEGESEVHLGGEYEQAQNLFSLQASAQKLMSLDMPPLPCLEMTLMNSDEGALHPTGEINILTEDGLPLGVTVGEDENNNQAAGVEKTTPEWNGIGRSPTSVVQGKRYSAVLQEKDGEGEDNEDIFQLNSDTLFAIRTVSYYDHRLSSNYKLAILFYLCRWRQLGRIHLCVLSHGEG